MKKKLVGLFLCMILLIPITAAVIQGDDSCKYLEGGWLEECDGVKILHVNGSYYQMGYQQGSFLQDEIKQNIRMMDSWLEQRGFSYDDLLALWAVMKEYLPEMYKDEMQGMADSVDVSFEQIAVYNTWPAVINHVLVSCCGSAAWGSATLDGKLYFMRSLDILHPGWGITDPETGTLFRENQVLIVRNPDDSYASVYPCSAGAVYSWGGMNEQGIAIESNTCLTYDSTFHGISAAFRMRMVLDSAASAEEAISIINAKRTCGWNFILSDGKIPRGYVIEQTANLLYVGVWFDPIESIDPFWEIEDVVRRCVMFNSPACAATQQERKQYDPSGLDGFLLFLLGKNLYFPVWCKYKALSQEIEKQYAALDVNSTMSLLRDVYLGKTDFLFAITQILSSFKALHQWVACPQTGDIVISFADRDTDTACKNPVYYLNFFDLLHAEPP